MISRRSLLQVGATAAGSLFIPKWVHSSPLAATEPRFFLQIVFSFGADNSYLFDARPLSMTRAGKIQNYTGVEPTPYVGQNGVQCLVSAAAQGLLAFKDDLCVINGVLMTTAFDGHDQNMNYLFTGNPFGGESFVPHLNRKSASLVPTNLDAIQEGFLFANISNGSSTVPLEAYSAQRLAQRLTQIPPAQPSDELAQFVKSRMQAMSQGTGRMSEGARHLLGGYESMVDLHQKMSQLQITATGSDPESDFVSLLGGLFKKQIARSALFVLPDTFDTHSAQQAQGQPALFTKSVEHIAKILQNLKNTPYDSQRSIFDMTTVMITSEFGRTMRIQGSPIDATGTNHNPLNNFVMLAGYGIKGGQVIGASDTENELALVSDAHKSLDPQLEKAMGKPFDFATQTSRTDLPTSFDIKDYLTINSVVNSVYTIFDVPPSQFRTLDRQGTIAPVVRAMLR